MYYRQFPLITVCYQRSIYCCWFSSFYFYIVVDGIDLIMPLLAREEVRLFTLNKIFILAHKITMGTFGIVKDGFFRLYLCNHCGDCPEILDFDNWGSVYSELRYHVSFLGWHFGRIVYVNYRQDHFRELVHITYYNGNMCSVFCNNFGFEDVILYPSFEGDLV